MSTHLRNPKEGYVEEPAVMDFVARKARIIALSKARGTEAVIEQATINLYSQFWKSLEDLLPGLFFIDLAEAYVTRESESSRIYVSKKGMIRNCPMDFCMRNLWQKAERGKKTGSESTTRFPQASCFKKTTHSVPESWGHTYNVLPWSAKAMRKWDKKSNSHSAKKGAKKLVSRDFANILE
jgi:hypothetical protein